MLKKDTIHKASKRRFDEVFLIDTEDLSASNDDLEYFLERIADYYEYISHAVPDFINTVEQKALLADKLWEEQKCLLYTQLKEIVSLASTLQGNSEVASLLKSGKAGFEASLNQGVAVGMPPDHSIYIEYYFTLEGVIKEPNQNYPLGDIKKILVSFRTVIFELQSLGKSILVTNSEEVLRGINSSLNVLDEIFEKIQTHTNYHRIESIIKIKNMWEYRYKKASGDIDLLKLELSLIDSSNSYSRTNAIKRLYKQYKLALRRFHFALEDWFDDQQYLEESLKDLKIWVELVNNDYFLERIEKVTAGNSAKKEKIIQSELSKFLFSSYRLLPIREPNFVTKIPDFWINTGNKNVVLEVKLLYTTVTKNVILETIKRGLLQLQNYTTTLKGIDSFCLVVFNYVKDAKLVNDIMESTFLEKPMYILPINTYPQPSKGKSILINKKDIDKMLSDLG